MTDATGRVVVLEAEHYTETRAALAKDPIIIQMAEEVAASRLSRKYLEGTGHHTFMTGSLREYKARGGTINTHIGGPAETILSLLSDEEAS